MPPIVRGSQRLNHNPGILLERKLTWRKLLAEGQTLRGAHELKPLAQFLSERHDIYDPLEEHLRDVDTSRIPALPVAEGDALANPIVKKAVQAMASIGLILLSFSQGASSPELGVYADKSFKSVLKNVVITAANLVRAIAISAPEEPDCAFAEELISQTRTVDLAFLLICRKDPATGRYWTLPAQGSLKCCFLADLLQAYTDTQLGWDSMAARLLAASPQTRKAVVRSLIIRVQELTNTGTAASAQCVFQAVFKLVAHPLSSLDRDFERQHFLSKFAFTLFTLSSRALAGVSDDEYEWDHIAVCFALLASGTTVGWGANPFVNVPRLVQGKIFSTRRHLRKAMNPFSAASNESYGCAATYNILVEQISKTSCS